MAGMAGMAGMGGMAGMENARVLADLGVNPAAAERAAGTRQPDRSVGNAGEHRAAIEDGTFCPFRCAGAE